MRHFYSKRNNERSKRVWEKKTCKYEIIYYYLLLKRQLACFKWFRVFWHVIGQNIFFI